MKTDNHFTITCFYCTTWHGETHLFFLPEGLFCIMKHCKLISHSTKKHLSIEVLKKQGYKDSNLELTESESVALPFGDSPMCLFFACLIACDKWYYTTGFLKLQPLFSIFFIFPQKNYSKVPESLILWVFRYFNFFIFL